MIFSGLGYHPTKEKMVESNVCKLLEGLSIEDNDELCDFTLADQNEVVGK